MSAPQCTELESPLSEDLHVLMERAENNTKHFDVIIIGSGYGGAIAASELAVAKNEDGTALNICVLERGKQYLPGMFPAKMAELAGHVRYATQTDDKPHGVREGLFDIRLGDDVCTLLASGLGGGSLINAGVLEEPDPSVFDHGWPQAVRSAFGSQGGTHTAPDRVNGQFSPEFETTANLLGAQFSNNDDRDKNEKCINLKKRQRHAELGGAQFRGAQIISVLNKDGYTTTGGIQLDPCNNCGDCMTGCNHSAKISLDTSLLAKAKRSAPESLKLVTGATVLRLERDNKRWSLKVVHTAEHPRQHQGKPYQLTANKVILSAGCLGSTEILLRSEKKGELQFSSKLGQQFSTNGDNVLAIYNLSDEVNAVADEAIEPFSRRVGPTITGIIDTQISGNTGGLGQRFLAEEFSIPGPLRRIFEEIFTNANTLLDISETDKSEHRPGTPDDRDPFAFNRDHIARTSLIGINGHDSADGVLKLKSLKNSAEITDELGDGLIEIQWKELKQNSIFDEQIKRMKCLLDSLDSQKRANAKIIPNPLWHPLPEKLTNILDGAKGPLLTVHPLGGCPMGEDITSGVVDAYGRVFDPSINNQDHASWFGSLVVLDGAIIPTSIGVNPSLSIATLARWAVTHLRDKEWKYSITTPGNLPPRRLPKYRQPTYLKAKDTKVEMLERLSGMADIDGQRKRIELTLKFQSVSLLSLMQNMDRRIDLNVDLQHRNTLRIYADELAWQDAYNHRVADEVLENVNGCTTIEITSGHIQVLNRVPKNDQAITRIQRTIWPWWCNRGKRDTWQTLETQLSNLAALFRPFIMGGIDFSVLYLAHSTDLDELTFRKKNLLWLLKKLPVNDKSKLEALIEGLISTASHAGEQRTILYELHAVENKVTKVIKGKKLLTYGYASNPIHQLSELELTEFMGHPIIKRNSKLSEPKNLVIPGNCLFGYIVGIVLYVIFTKPLNYLSNLFTKPVHTEEENDDWILKLDTRYLAKKRLPLIRITEMQDMPNAMMDFISFGSYMARLMTSIHLWTYRKPDDYPEKNRSTTTQLLTKIFSQKAPDAIDLGNLNADSGNSRRANLLPAKLPGLKDPEIIELTVKTSLEDNKSTTIRLTRYSKNVHSSGDRTPIVMIHGYSASGTTFAHAAIPQDITRFLSQRNQERDIWILDLRTSSGMNTATTPWKMEEVGCNDIPIAIAHVREMTGQQQVDVITHCVGSAMFSMAVLIAPNVGDANYAERKELPKWIRSVVLSQYGPVVAVTPDNAARAFAIDHLRHYVNDTAYQFQGDVAGTNRILDRLLSALYYPRAEFFIENPQETAGQPSYLENTAWTKTRHRMDALYGRTFNLANMDKNTLESIDDFFGPMNLDTLAQMIPFSRTRRVTGRQGDNVLDLPNSMPLRWLFPTLSLHGAQNGMIDIATKTLMEGLFKGFANKGYRAIAFPHLGHQDSFIGTKAATAPLFQAIRDFHNNLPTHGVSTPAVQHAEQPWLGPIVETITNTAAGQLLPFCVAPSPTLPWPDRLIVLCGATINNNVWGSPTTITLLDLPIQKNSCVNGWIRAEIDLSQLAQTNAASPKFAHVLFIYTLPEWMTEKTEAELIADRQDPSPSNLTLVKRLRQRINPQEFDKTKIALRQPDTATFALGSCQYPAGLTTEIPASGSYKRLASIFEPKNENAVELLTPVFLLLIGDQIYIDETAGVFSPKTREDQDVKKYEALYQNRAVRKVLRNIPSYSMLDDHEIEDNYEPDNAPSGITARGRESQERKRIGIENYWKYQRRSTTPPLYFEMTRQLGTFSCPFFICDTRSERDCRYPNGSTAKIINDLQMTALKNWLTPTPSKVKPDLNPKFIASPSMFLPRRIESKSNNPRGIDAWDGYPQSLYSLLQFIYDSDIKNLVFLSGDAHLSCTATVTIRKENEERITTIHSIHSSGLYTPYPFANAQWEDYLATDTFFFCGDNNSNYQCDVVATQSATKGDGFALISLLEDQDGGTRLEVRFDLAGGISSAQFPL